MSYIPTIGIEVHVELKTNTKIFSPSSNTYGKSANTNVNEIDLGYPGTLPNINEKVIDLGIKTAYLLNCKINKHMHFDRKNYFYPDNPKNYQITQAETPIGTDGFLEIEIDGKTKKIYIEELHIEEDTCKSTHRKTKTYLDFNRAGVPLIEIVTKPCISSSKEACLYLEKLKETLFYAGISDCKMEEGSMRCEPNISLRKNENDKLGTKVEIKNVGSIHSVGVAIEKEIKRQEKLLDNNETFKEQTRRFDSKLNDTVLMRVKETGNDYRYFPEPDIPFVNLTDEQIEKSIKELPIMPNELRKIYNDKGIKLNSINKLIENKNLSDFFNELLVSDINFSTASNLLLEDIEEYLNKNKIDIKDTKLTKDKFIKLVNYKDNGTLTSKNIKDILKDIMEKDDELDEIIKSNNIENIKDDSFIRDIVINIINNNNDAVNDYKKRPDRTIKFFMGQVMKESRGKANPKVATSIIEEELNKINN